MTRYWFRPKRYGYGATPVTWEGWALTVGIVAVVALPIVAMNLLADRSNVGAWLAWAAFIVIACSGWFVSAGSGPMVSGVGVGVSAPMKAFN
jgi:hypothetical protein